MTASSEQSLGEEFPDSSSLGNLARFGGGDVAQQGCDAIKSQFQSSHQGIGIGYQASP